LRHTPHSVLSVLAVLSETSEISEISEISVSSVISVSRLWGTFFVEKLPKNCKNEKNVVILHFVLMSAIQLKY
jgi:hypothetical protein